MSETESVTACRQPGGGTPRPAPRRLGLLLLLLLGGSAAALLALEGVCRLFERRLLSPIVSTADQAEFTAAGMFTRSDDRALSFANRPLAQVVASGREYRHDAHGFRVMPAAGGGPGVAFLGDSTTYGWGTAAADCLPALAGQLAGGAFTPVNLGVCGYQTEQEVALYARHRRHLDGVAVVVLVLFPNDFARGVFTWDPRLKWLYMDLLPLPAALKPHLMHSALYRVVMGRHSEWVRRGEEYQTTHPDNWRRAAAAIRRLHEMVREDGRELVVAHLPEMELSEPYPWEEGVRHVADACRALGVRFVDMLPAFVAEADRRIRTYEADSGEIVKPDLEKWKLSQFWVHVDDHHLNADGNLVAARVLAPAIRHVLEGPAAAVRVSTRPLASRAERTDFELELMRRVADRVAERTGARLDVRQAGDLDEQLALAAAAGAELFVMSPLTYLIASARGDVAARFAATKRDGAALYQAALCVRAASGISSLADLGGRGLVLDVEEGGHPLREALVLDLLRRAGLLGEGGVRLLRDPRVDRVESLRRLLAGGADAAVTVYAPPGPDGLPRDGRLALAGECQDVLERLVVLAVSEPLPYPVIASRRGFEPERHPELFAALGEVLVEEGSALIASFGRHQDRLGFAAVDDAAFDPLRALCERNGIAPRALLAADDDTY